MEKRRKSGEKMEISMILMFFILLKKICFIRSMSAELAVKTYNQSFYQTTDSAVVSFLGISALFCEILHIFL